MAQAALENLKAAGIERPKGADGTPAPIPNTADTGYFSEKAVGGWRASAWIRTWPSGRQKHHERPLQPRRHALGRGGCEGEET